MTRFRILESTRRRRITVDEIMELVQGFKDGRVVQSRCSPEQPWKDNPDPSFDFVVCEWRLKPEEEIW